ncbi:PEP-CTERM sorting domain-containing protein [Microcystis aeruginosa]|uniref:PEP-CTERM sorting domain-containing protein n=1 Tax=Microcystis aeruginosa TaxID=1126 RepID=UPI0021AB8BC2|nr:PEP-CTERM sorting domain-containing protein [Microcystis aeruginosa]
MKTQPALTLIATAIALSLPVALAPQTHAATVVAPNQTSNAGLSTALIDGNRTYLMQYGASLLSGINVGDQITGLTFRLSSSGTGSSVPPSSPATSFTNWDLTLAQAANPISSLSTTFASNLTNPVLVRSGALAFAAGAFPGGAVNPTTNPFGPVINFTTPYTYQGGDLVVLISHTGGTNAVGFLDALNIGAPGYDSVFRALSANLFNAAIATTSYQSFTITQFTTSPALPPATTPEPSALVGLGAVVGLGASFKRRRAQADKN